MTAWPASILVKPQLQQRRCSRSAALAGRIVQQAHSICILFDGSALPEIGHGSPELTGAVRGSGPVQLTKAQHGDIQPHSQQLERTAVPGGRFIER